MINIDSFIAKHVTKRTESMFKQDIVEHSEQLQQNIAGKTVLVIGGAGSIGSSFIKALLPFKPSSLVVVDVNENGLTELTRELRSTNQWVLPQDYVTYPMSYADDVFAKMFIHRKGFDIVANFSAHKHVRSEKDKFSVEALLKNNVLNAKHLLDLLTQYPPEHFFCVSTDKAANPVNVMGGSKKIMEDMIMAYADKFPVTTARFANVAFSNGSLPAGFLERITKRQPISAPSDVTRYFVSPEESGQICLMACILGKTGQIYFPKLKKEQVMTFSEIAELLLKALGYEAENCSNEEEALQKAHVFQENQTKYPVYFSKSDTTGEKPYEEFFTEGESVNMDLYSSLGVVDLQEFKTKEEVEILINSLYQLFEDTKTEKSDIVGVMKDFLVNFDHQEMGKYLDSKM
ncbi:UDP-N-acetylglucosamine 4,6-dehydratase [Capnocytophaga canis]|uniref:UDP-N-acetylglucosamine 4,6-dehydratase n=1 Tax=Capnocytophaga canis TaxID=1848903 RepID=UPI0037D35897